MQGYILTHRKMQKHWIWSDAEWLRAWLTILFEVNHSEQKVLIKGQVLECCRGESLNSLDTWGKLFGGWSKNRVARFFERLQCDQMVVLKTERITTRLSVCNYNTYQDMRNAERYADGTQAERRRTTNKEGTKNEPKNDKPSLPFSDFEQSYPRGEQKASAEKTWKKLTIEQQQEALAAIKAYVAEKTNKDGECFALGMNKYLIEKPWKHIAIQPKSNANYNGELVF